MKNHLLTLCILVLFWLCVYFFWILKQSYFNNKDITNRENAIVNKVIDWDTVSVILSWNIVLIRLIWIDSPEKTSKRFGYVECYGKESTNYLESLLPKWSNIELEYDYSQWLYDAYGRILAYIFLNWDNINEKIIENWYWWEYTYDKPYRYQTKFIKVENFASKNKFWLWNTCNWKRVAIK